MPRHQAFKRKYEMMGKLEEERLLAEAGDRDSIEHFSRFVDEVLDGPVDPEIKQRVREIELQSDIELHALLRRIP